MPNNTDLMSKEVQIEGERNSTQVRGKKPYDTGSLKLFTFTPNEPTFPASHVYTYRS